MATNLRLMIVRILKIALNQKKHQKKRRKKMMVENLLKRRKLEPRLKSRRKLLKVIITRF
jgi:hypothetical protein